MRPMARLALGTILALVVEQGCSTPGTLLEGLAANLSVSGVYPNMVVPGIQLMVTGAGFVGPQIGTTQVRLEAPLGGEAEVRMQTLAEVASNETLSPMWNCRFQARARGRWHLQRRVLVECHPEFNKIHRPAPSIH